MILTDEENSDTDIYIKESMAKKSFEALIILIVSKFGI